MPVPLFWDARPAGWFNYFSICASTIPRAQKRAGKGSILLQRQFTFRIFLLFIYDSGYLPRGLVLSKSFYSLNTSTLRGLPIGWSDLEIKCYTFYVVPNCCWTPIPKCHVFLMPLSFQKIWTVTLKSAHKKLFKVFKACGRGEPIL